MSGHDNKFDFEAAYNKFYGPIDKIHQQLKYSTKRIPTVEQREEKIKRLSGSECVFALMDELDIDKISGVENLRFPFDKKGITNKEFFTYIHPAYFVPYLIFAKFAYDLARKIEVPADEILKARYKMLLPLRLPKQPGEIKADYYSWYTQHAYPITLNEHNQVINHVNIYQYDRECLGLAGDKIEKRFMEGTVMLDARLYVAFQNYLIKEMSLYLESVFREQLYHWEIIQLLKIDIDLRNKEIAERLKLEKTTIDSYNKDIIDKIERLLGYRFTTLREAVIALKDRNYI